MLAGQASLCPRLSSVAARGRVRRERGEDREEERGECDGAGDGEAGEDEHGDEPDAAGDGGDAAGQQGAGADVGEGDEGIVFGGVEGGLGRHGWQEQDMRDDARSELGHRSSEIGCYLQVRRGCVWNLPKAIKQPAK